MNNNHNMSDKPISFHKEDELRTENVARESSDSRTVGIPTALKTIHISDVNTLFGHSLEAASRAISMKKHYLSFDLTSRQ
ncbi:hypothetical protein GcC1_172003 [Golovinomyces cichoracearum]|uniref:Uncharacterized protein n=1 Tax=Golovinomyces cichoracearum TaxID=62708 RepID=A0A420HQQ7_9PEZI|nr:hypothetical protein GcC1_172003 [Golovinomyces cichoracearum]